MTPALVDVRGLCVDYPVGRRWLWSRRRLRRVVEDVDLRIGAGQTVGLIGESGSGKTSVGRTLIGLVRPAQGSIRIGDWDVGELQGNIPFAYRRIAQMVWQDPWGSLTPTMRVAEVIGDALRRTGIGAADRRAKVARVLDQVGLRPSDGGKFPHEFSGGQRQRIALARALVLEPRLIVLDEPVSALDVITQSQILRLLEEVQRDTGVSYLLISHDVGVVRYLATAVSVLYQGRIVEAGGVDEVFDRPNNPYTRQLIASVLEPGRLQPQA